MSSASQSISVSAPGKVLFAGGFLVLDRQHTGLVFGLNARIHVSVRSRSSGEKGDHEDNALILVESPQFRNARWLYRVSKPNPEGSSVTVDQIKDDDQYTKSGNKFVETTLRYALTYLSHLSKNVFQSIHITILADDDYYSQSASSSRPNETGTTGFTDFGVSLSDAHKTGLGSSAALTTALVGALIAFFLPSSEDLTNSSLPLAAIHNLAQAGHCAAQGKVGSGFDVAAAVYGSCLYRRFTPSILENVGEPSSPDFGERLHRCVSDLELDQKWDVEVATRAVEVPESLLLVMCDVDCGSETPGMVRNILKWRKEKSDEANLLWMALQQGADDLCQELKRLASMTGIGSNSYQELGDIILTIRSLVREMSNKSDVPVEPPVITELLDHCTSLPGVVGGVAPGAGGYDAVALLLRNDPDVVRELQKSLEGWKSRTNAGATIGKVRLLGVKQDKEGVRLESSSQYQSWL